MCSVDQFEPDALAGYHFPTIYHAHMVGHLAFLTDIAHIRDLVVSF